MTVTVPSLRSRVIRRLPASVMIVSLAVTITTGCRESAVTRYAGLGTRMALIAKAVVVVDMTFENSAHVDAAKAKARGNALVETVVDALLLRGYPIDQGELISDEKDPNIKARLFSVVAKMRQSHPENELDSLLFPDAILLGSAMDCGAVFVVRAHLYDPSLWEKGVDALFSKLLTGSTAYVQQPEVSVRITIVNTWDGMLIWDDVTSREFKQITVESLSQVVSDLVGRLPHHR
jgi:hypothetical protein